MQPSPTTEKPSFWHSKSNTSTASSNHRSLLNENEPFNISRESFDSYRRSFVRARRRCASCADWKTHRRTGYFRPLSHPRVSRPTDAPVARYPPVTRHSALTRHPTLARRAPFSGPTAVVVARAPPRKRRQPRARGRRLRGRRTER